MVKNSHLVKILLLVSASCLGAGIALPIMEVQPHLGPYHSYLGYFFKELDTPQSFSIINGVLHLFADGRYFIASLMLLFSVIFPCWKITVLWIGFDRLVQGEHPGNAFHWAEKLGKYSMIDVFVIALLILAIKGLPGGSQVILHIGLYSFAGSVLCSLKASWLIDKYWIAHPSSVTPKTS